MRRIVVASLFLMTVGLAAADLSARHRYRSRVCDVVHPAHYFHSLGRRRHRHFGIDHYRRYHYRPRYRYDYGHDRRYDRHYRGRGRYQGRGHYRGRGRGHYRDRHYRPGFSLGFEYRGDRRHRRGPRRRPGIGVHIDIRP